MNFARILIFGACVFQLAALLDSVHVQCSYITSFWNYLGSIYRCDVQKDPTITTRQSAIIDSVRGTHSSGQNDNRVVGFQAVSKTVHFFPQNLEKVFINLKGIVIYSCGLKELRRSDLRAYSKLELLDVYDNEIIVIEKGLFDYNPLLGYIGMSYNKIIHIDFNIFDHLTKLTWLKLEANICVNKDVQGDRTKVTELVSVVKCLCNDQNFIAIEKNLQELEEDLAHVNCETFPILNEKFEQIESQAINSNLSRIFHERISVLKDQESWTIRKILCSVEKSISEKILKQSIAASDSNLKQELIRSSSDSNSHNRVALDLIQNKMMNQEQSTNSNLNAFTSSMNTRISNLEKILSVEIANLKESVNTKISNLEHVLTVEIANLKESMNVQSSRRNVQNDHN